MPRIDAPLATQMADTARPRQTNRDLRLQAEVVRSDALKGRETALPATPPAADDLRAAAARLKQVVEVASGRQLRFDIDDESDAFLVKIKDEANGEVIKQIPSEEVLDLRRRLDELVGMLVDKTV